MSRHFVCLCGKKRAMVLPTSAKLNFLQITCIIIFKSASLNKRFTTAVFQFRKGKKSFLLLLQKPNRNRRRKESTHR